METAFLTHDDVLNRYQRYASELFDDSRMAMKAGRDGRHDGAMSRVDAELLYTVLRDLRPKEVIEFSPNFGYSTAFIASALRENGNGARFSTFDLELYKAMVERMQRFGLDAVFHKGDALTNVPLYIVEHGLVGNVDFCFIDSDHSYDFARRYCAEIIPLLGPRCVMFIHDMCYRPQDFQAFSHYGEILPYEIGGTYSSLGEAAYLQEWYCANQDYYAVFSTHRLFGDSHEYSSILPRNERLIKDLAGNHPDFSLPQSAGQEGGIPRCPMGLWVVPRMMLTEDGI